LNSVRRSLRFVAALSACSILALAVPPGRALAVSSGPAVAVLDFSTRGLTGNWWGNFEPGVAISDLLTDQLVNGGKFNVVDRSHLDSVLSEHKLSSEGEVSPASAISAGRLVGAKFLITGNVLQFDKTGQSGAAAGGLIGGAVGGAIGGINQSRVTLKVQVRVIDATTGQIVQSFADEQTKTNTSIGFGGFGGGAAGSYSNSNFVNSTMGHLVNDEAAIIAAQLDPSKFASAPAAPALSGRVLEVSGTTVTLNIGSSKGVAVGQYFDVIQIHQIKDPDSGKMLTSTIPIGKIQITSVSPDTSVGKRISGTASALDHVQSE
jgi:curli biogenesis system outer membrane secretion channel CsgG